MLTVTGKNSITHGCILLLFLEFLLKHKTQLEIVKSRSLMNFSVGILQIFMKLVQLTSSATITGVCC